MSPARIVLPLSKFNIIRNDNKPKIVLQGRDIIGEDTTDFTADVSAVYYASK